MKNILIGLFFAILFLNSPISSAQVYPVQTFVQISPPYNSYLPDYADPFTNQMRVILTLTDFAVPSTQVKLRFSIEGSGYSMQSADLVAFPSITLTPGVPVEISGSDLAPYLSTENLVFSGLNPADYEISKILPEGPATICVEVIDVTSALQPVVGNPACGQTWFSLYDPPLLNMPFCGTDLTPVDPQNVLFSWTPLHMASPLSGSTEYIFELFEIRPDAADPNFTVNATLPIYIEITTNTFVNYSIVQPPLQVGLSYVWRVKARDPSNRNLYRNNGYSTVCTFTYGSIAGSLIGDITLELNSNGTGVRQGLAWWNASDLFDSYTLEVRKTGNPAYEWFPYSTAEGQLKVNSLEASTEYECRVKGLAGGAETDWSNTSTFTTQAQPEYACGTTVLPAISPVIKPLNFLLPGNIVSVGQFEMTVTSAELAGIPGHFNGYGKINIPFMLMNLNVVFDDIFIDEDMVMRTGRVEAITEGIDEWLENASTIFIAGIINQPGGFEFGEDSTVTVYFGDESMTFEFSGTEPLVFQDESGLVYTVYADGTIVVGGNYTWDDDVLAATGNHKITFHAYSDQLYGFDEKSYLQWTAFYPCIQLADGGLYFVPYKSVASGESDILVAHIHSDTIVSNPTFKYADGTLLSATKINDTTYHISVGNSPVSSVIYAYDNVGGKIGKANLSVYTEKSRNVIVVPVNGAIVPADLENNINTIFAQANASFDITLADNYTNSDYDLNDNGLESPDATLMQKYSPEMRALRDAYFEENDHESQTYYLFIVPEFDTELDGYMVRGKGIGFIKSNETAHTYAHELGHGAFGLEHTFPTLPQGSSNNLMDYTAENDHLSHKQWLEIQEFNPVFSILDDEEDGSAYGAFGTQVIVICNEEILNTINQHNRFYDLNGNVLDFSSLPETTIVNRFYSIDDVTNEARGTVNGFIYENIQYAAFFTGTEFLGYYPIGSTNFESPPFNCPISEDEGVRVNIDCKKSEFWFDQNQTKYAIDCSECLPTIKEKFFTQNEAEIVQYFIENHSELVQSNFGRNEELIAALTETVSQELDENFLDEKTQDRLTAYSILNDDRRIIIAPYQCEIINQDELSWHLLADNVFKEAGLEQGDILITIPYIHCLGIGRDEGVIFCMVGLSFGNSVNVDLENLATQEFSTSLRYADWKISGPLNVREFVNGVFKHTEKYLRIYEAILQPNLSINLNTYEKEAISGFAQNCYINLNKNVAFDQIKALAISHQSDIDEVREGGQITGAQYTTWLDKAREYKRTQIFRILVNSDPNSIISYEPPDRDKFQFKDEFLIEFAEDYIYKRAFRQYFNILDQFEINFTDPVDFAEPETDKTWNRESYAWQVIDDWVYGSIDISSAVLGFFGLDFISDGIGVIYASARGDWENSSVYSMAVIIVGANAPAIKMIQKSLLTSSTKAIIRKQGDTFIIENLDELIHELRYTYKIHNDLSTEDVLRLKQYIDEGKLPTGKLTEFKNAQNNLATQLRLLNEAATYIDESLRAALKLRYANDHPNILTWIDETNDNAVLRKLDDLDKDLHGANLNSDLTSPTLKDAFDENPGLLDAWEILMNAGKTELRKSLDALNALQTIRKNPKIVDFGITDDMLGAIEGIPNVSYAEILHDLNMAINALPKGKTVDFYKVIADGNRGLVNSNNVWDRRHSWLTLKKIKENELFLSNADEVRFEVELELIDGINHAVPDIMVTVNQNGVLKIIIGEVKAGDKVITGNFNNQCIRYFNEISDIRDLRLFRRDGVQLTKQQVIDSWKNGGLLDDNTVFQLFQKYDIEVTQTYSLNVKSQLESYLTTNNEWFDLIFNSTF